MLDGSGVAVGESCVVWQSSENRVASVPPFAGSENTLNSIASWLHWSLLNNSPYWSNPVGVAESSITLSAMKHPLGLKNVCGPPGTSQYHPWCDPLVICASPQEAIFRVSEMASKGP